jgi:hypothetical protein
LHTTKASASDKKLYKQVEASLETRHKELVRFSASLSPPDADMLMINSKRSSPFGSLSEVKSRKTFTYLIATLNAAHPDYDFSHVLRPQDFRRERSLRTVIHMFDDTIHNLRPRATGGLMAPPAWNPKLSAGPQTPGGAQTWGYHSWRAIDKEMTLKECEIYCYSPDEDPFDGEENALWSMNYLFYNKLRKRVCYIYLRGLSVSSHSPLHTFDDTKTKRPRSTPMNDPIDSKRMRYWAVDTDGDFARSTSAGLEDDYYANIAAPEDDDTDYLDPSDYSSLGFSDIEEEEEEPIVVTDDTGRAIVRAMSEHIMDAHIMESMEV